MKYNVGDIVKLNIGRLDRHVPFVKGDNETHIITEVILDDGKYYYVLDDFPKNYFLDYELMLNDNIKDKKSNKRKMTLEQIEATLGFEIEIIESNKKRKRKWFNVW